MYSGFSTLTREVNTSYSASTANKTAGQSNSTGGPDYSELTVDTDKDRFNGQLVAIIWAMILVFFWGAIIAGIHLISKYRPTWWEKARFWRRRRSDPLDEHELRATQRRQRGRALFGLAGRARRRRHERQVDLEGRGFHRPDTPGSGYQGDSGTTLWSHATNSTSGTHADDLSREPSFAGSGDTIVDPIVDPALQALQIRLARFQAREVMIGNSRGNLYAGDAAFAGG